MRCLNISYFLAESTIKDYFSYNEESKRQDEDLLAYCQEKFPPMFSLKFAYRVQRRKINHIIVRAVLASLPPLNRDVIVRRYKLREIGTKIAMDLKLSITRITLIDRAVQENLNYLLQYRLTSRDLYSRIKVVNMIHVIDLRLAFLEQHPELLPDVSRDWIESLNICREKYRLLYSAMEEIIQKADVSIMANIVSARLRNPLLTSKELSAICHVSQNGVNRYLRRYEEVMSKYLVA